MLPGLLPPDEQVLVRNLLYKRLILVSRTYTPSYEKVRNLLYKRLI